MATPVTVYTILRLYASKRQSPEIMYTDFSNYLIKYAQKFAEEQPELVPFLTNPQNILATEIEKLLQEKKIQLKMEKDSKFIVVTSYFKDQLVNRYREIAANAAIAFPITTDLPKNFPQNMLVRREAADLIYEMYDGEHRDENLSENTIYALIFKKDIEAVLIPEGVSPDLLLEISVSKIRRLMSKTGQYEYFLKKLITANPTRDISAKAFFTQFVNQTTVAIRNLKEGGESFYFWNQLFSFIRNDYEKIQDRMQDDTALLQSTYITEVAAAYYKSKTQMNLQKETALKNLELSLEKPPYYFSYNDIVKFTDSRGIPLLGQYDQNDLNAYIQKISTNGDATKMSHLLSFRLNNGDRIFIVKEKIIPLVIKLCSESHDTLRKVIVKDWFNKLKNYEKEDAMFHDEAFEKKLIRDVQINQPILYAVLNASFLPVVYHEAVQSQDKSAAAYKLLRGDNLLPYNELLILSRTTLLSDAKILLPVWYTIPIISFFISLFVKRKKVSGQKSEQEISEQTLVAPEDIAEKSAGQQTKRTKRESLRNAAISAEKILVPPGSNLSTELMISEDEWNRILDPRAKRNLTEDVNALIRDYIRNIVKTIGPTAFTIDRIKNLTDTLLKMPALDKIKDRNHLHRYIQLYMIKVVKDL